MPLYGREFLGEKNLGGAGGLVGDSGGNTHNI